MIPTLMLGEAFMSYGSVKQLCDTFDASEAAMLSAVGGDEYATMTQVRGKRGRGKESEREREREEGGKCARV